MDTDFICKIKKVVNETSLLLDIPFTAVSELIGRHNEDSPYSKNNLVDIKGYTVLDDPNKQNVFHKKNFYILSIDSGNFEIFHNKIPIQNSVSTTKKSILDIEINKVRVLCGNLYSYKVYGKSLNSPENSTLLCEGKIEPDEHISTNNFNNGLYNDPGKFFNSSHVSKYWKKSTANCIFNQDNSVLIDGVKIGHLGNSNQTDYIIFKDNTSTSTSTYSSYSLLKSSYWYTNRNVFLNHKEYPSSSYLGTSEVPVVSTYPASQENLINGSIHDSNPIKLRSQTLYKFSMLVKSTASNTVESKIYVYFVSGTEKIQIGYIDNSFNFGANQEYEYTFFSDISRYGTIMFVPVLGTWYISSVSLAPYQTLYHSIDSFRIKIPIIKSIKNELYEIEMELYDSKNRLAYGKNSYTFSYNKTFLPLKTKVFIDPAGLIN